MKPFYFAELTRTGWRVFCDYTAIGGAVMDICAAIDEPVARATAAAMNERIAA